MERVRKMDNKDVHMDATLRVAPAVMKSDDEESSSNFQIKETYGN